VPGRLKPFWRILAQSWPLRWPRARMRAEIGAEALEIAERVGLLDSTPIADGDDYPCRCPLEDGCAMRVVDEDGLVAVCGRGASCSDERLSDADAAWSHASPTTLTPVLQRAARLEVAPVTPVRDVWILGQRSVGATAFRFVLAPRPSRSLHDGTIDRLANEDPNRVLVVLCVGDTPTMPSVPARTHLVPLRDHLHPGDTPTIDLAAVYLASARGTDLRAELWPRYTWVADVQRGRFGYAGASLDLERKVNPARFLARLLAEPGQWVSRFELACAVWCDKSPSEIDLEDPDTDRNLRSTKAELSQAIKRIDPPAGFPRDPIENLRTRSGDDGGYRIAVEADRVIFLDS
jgi:hypothetical protein